MQNQASSARPRFFVYLSIFRKQNKFDFDAIWLYTQYHIYCSVFALFL